MWCTIFNILHFRSFIVDGCILSSVTEIAFEPHGCSNHSNLEMEAECLTKNISYLNLNISRRKNGRNKLWKVLESGRVIEHTDSFYLTGITEKKTCNFPLKVDDFQHLPCFLSIREAPRMHILGTKSSVKGLNRENTRKKMKFWLLNPYYKRSN